MMSIFFEGFFLQASLILALGAQNLFVLDSGLKKNRHLLVASICSVCDFLLIMIGVAGASSIFIQIPLLKNSLAFLGVIFLLYYGVKKIREAYISSFTRVEYLNEKRNFKGTLLLSIGFSLLNPHVYLDTVILIGGYASKFLVLMDRIFFGVGASIFSFIWFFSLAILSSAFNKLLRNSHAMRWISLISGIILLYLSYRLGIELLGWIK